MHKQTARLRGLSPSGYQTPQDKRAKFLFLPASGTEGVRLKNDKNQVTQQKLAFERNAVTRLFLRDYCKNKMLHHA